MKKKIVSLLLSLLMCLSMPCISASAEDQVSGISSPANELTAVSGSNTKGITNPELTLERAQQMDISECIEIANSITPPANNGVGVTSVEISPAEAAAIERVLEYDRQQNEGIAVYSRAAAYDFSSEYYYDQLTSAEKKTYNEILSVFNDCINSTKTYSDDCIGYVTNYAARTKNEMDHLYQMFYYSNPQIFCTFNGYGWSSDYSKIYLYINEDCMNGSTRSKVKQTIDNTTTSWLSTMNSIEGTVAKEKWLAEKVAATVTYTKIDYIDQTIMGALYLNKCVCNGYAMTMNYFCNAAGIECITVVSSVHAWNRIKLYDKWYELDVTWMDNDNAENTCDYNWFNKSSATFMANDPYGYHDPETDWDVGSYFYSNISIPDCVDEDPSDLVFDEAKVTAFVERLYANLLGRSPDPSGKASHINRLKSGESACDVVKRFVLSTELANKKLTNREFVKRMYLTMLDRSPDAAGLARWATALDNGCSYGYVLQGFGNSAEFTRLCASYGIVKGSYTSPENRDRNANLTAYVSRMYTKALGRKYDVRGLNSHTGKYLAGTSNAKDIAYAFIFSAEFKNKNLTDEQFVDTLYQALFDRNADAGGKSRWLTKMKNGMTREQVFSGFATSAEFKNMVAGFGI
ncbi:MAG: DUF4214 domain-containing protein [Huintestinicola sp.]|uniref:DUF4214 domain-containing protein n=1 Tax=Huintestinicola sp. TaxID=2981661 RepID=UPI003F05FA2E